MIGGFIVAGSDTFEQGGALYAVLALVAVAQTNLKLMFPSSGLVRIGLSMRIG